MVSPVFSASGDVLYYLPEGTWTHLLSGEKREGGKWMRENYDYFSLPLFVRENTILPIGGNDQRPDYDYGKDLTLRVYELKTEAETLICDEKGNDMLKVTAKKEDGKYIFTFGGRHENLRILLMGIDKITGEYEASDDGAVIAVADDADEITITL
jgi:alpha-D-xyloside xylohydrolase